jgi:hypothetical protein
MAAACGLDNGISSGTVFGTGSLKRARRRRSSGIRSPCQANAIGSRA